MDDKPVESTRLPIECPNSACGAPGLVPFDHLSRQLFCKECGVRFYMDVHGTGLIIGERPADLGAIESSMLQHSGKRSTPLLVERLESKWRALPQVWKTRAKAGGAVGFLALIVLVSNSSFRPGPKFPKDLDGRAQFVADALIRGQRSNIVALATSSTASDLAEWVDQIRPKDWSTNAKSRPILEVRSRIVTQNMKAKTSCVSVEFKEPGAARPSVPPPPPPVEEVETVEAPAEGIPESMPASNASGEDTTMPPTPAAPQDPGAAGPPAATAPDEKTEPAPEPAFPATESMPEGDVVEEKAVEPQPPPPQKPKLHIFLYWTYVSDDDGWLIDGTQTLTMSGLAGNKKPTSAK